MNIFSAVEPIRYQGPDGTSDLAHPVYDKDRVVMGNRMEDWLRCAVCYWHSFNWPGADIFGASTLPRPWLGATITQHMANQKLDAAFDFLSRLGVPYFTFHDVDAMVTRMAQTRVKLLWGTANLFSHPRYAAGAATSPDPEVFAWAAAQVRLCFETTQRLGGENYVMNRGDPRNGWDTDQFPNNAQELTPALLLLLGSGGFGSGGFNFDAKLRHQSVDASDLFLAHIGGIDTLARALLAAASLIETGRIKSLITERYAGWSGELGQRIARGDLDLAALADHATAAGLDQKPRTGKQELYESLVANAASGRAIT